LLARQHQQFGVGGEQFADGILKLVTGLDAGADQFGPMPGDAFDAAAALVDKGQGPTGMAGVLGVGAMAGGFATSGGGLGERARQQVFGEGEAAQEFKLALAEAGGLGAFGSGEGREGGSHLEAIMLQEKQNRKDLFGTRK
jgi:hypothetical protein